MNLLDKQLEQQQNQGSYNQGGKSDILIVHQHLDRTLYHIQYIVNCPLVSKILLHRKWVWPQGHYTHGRRDTADIQIVLLRSGMFQMCRRSTQLPPGGRSSQLGRGMEGRKWRNSYSLLDKVHMNSEQLHPGKSLKITSNNVITEPATGKQQQLNYCRLTNISDTQNTKSKLQYAL